MKRKKKVQLPLFGYFRGREKLALTRLEEHSYSNITIVVNPIQYKLVRSDQ